MAFFAVVYGVVRYCRDDFVLCEKQSATAPLGKVSKALDVGKGVVKAVSARAAVDVKGFVSLFHTVFKSGESVRIVFIPWKLFKIIFRDRTFYGVEITYGEVWGDSLPL